MPADEDHFTVQSRERVIGAADLSMGRGFLLVTLSHDELSQAGVLRICRTAALVIGKASGRRVLRVYDRGGPTLFRGNSGIRPQVVEVEQGIEAEGALAWRKLADLLCPKR